MKFCKTLPDELKWRCRVHPNALCDFICLDGDANDRVVCFSCVQNQQIPISNLISMSYILAANEQDILSAYPPLKDQKLSDKIRGVNLKKSAEEMDRYFKNLREEFEKQMQQALQKVKQYQSFLQKSSQPLFNEYFRIAEIEKLKQLIKSDKQEAAKDLDNFIKDKWKKADENKNNMLKLIEQYEIKNFQQSYSFNEIKQIPQKTIEILKNINFNGKSNIEQVTLLKSTYNTSQSMQISKVDNLVYEIKKQGTKNCWDQVFLDPILNPSKKYILNIELEQRSGNTNNYFFFGLVKDQEKDNSFAYGSSMCYYDYSNDFGITKIIKGYPLQSGTKVIGKHSFEIRIHLNEKFLRVASFPNYSSVAELDNQNKINPKVAYRFFLSIYCQNDIMRITNISTVNTFDELM